MTRMVTDGGPQADFVGELLLTNDEGLFASSSSYASSWLMMTDDEGLMMNDYSKKLGEMFGGLELFE